MTSARAVTTLGNVALFFGVESFEDGSTDAVRLIGMGLNTGCASAVTGALAAYAIDTITSAAIAGVGAGIAHGIISFADIITTEPAFGAGSFAIADADKVSADAAETGLNLSAVVGAGANIKALRVEADLAVGTK